MSSNNESATVSKPKKFRQLNRALRLTSVASLRRVTETDVARTWLHWRAGGADVAASGLGHVGRGGDGATGEVGLLRSA